MSTFSKFIVAGFIVSLSACASTGKGPDQDEPVSQADATPKLIPLGAPGTIQFRDEQANIIFEMLVAEISLQRGAGATAVEYYLDAAKRSQDARIAEQATRVASVVNAESEALEAAEIWAGADPESSDAKRILVVLYLRNQRYKEAEAALEQVLADVDEQRRPRAMLEVGDLLQREAPKRPAYDIAESFAVKYPDMAQASYVAGSLALGIKEYDLALSRAEHTLDIDPDWSDAVLLRARVLAGQDKLEHATEFLADYLKRMPKKDNVRMVYARMLVEQRELEAAREQFEMLAVKMPNNTDVLFALSMLSMQFRDHAAAEGYLGQLIKLGQRSPQSMYYMGQVIAAQDRFDEALVWYGRIRPGEFYLDAQFQTAAVLRKSEGIDAAQAHLHGIKPADAAEKRELVLFEGTLLRESRRYQAAYDLYTDALRDFPDDTDIIYGRALVAERLDLVDEAIESLNGIVKKEPENAAALNALGYTLADRTDRVEEALVLVQKALDIQPSDPAIIDSMGWVKYRMGKHDEALEYLGKAMDMVDDGEVSAHYGEVLWTVGRREEAIEVWNKAAKRFADNEILQRTRERFGQ